MNTNELRIMAARMLPEKITICGFSDFGGRPFTVLVFRWKSRFGGVRGDDIKQSEWLSICITHLEPMMDDWTYDRYTKHFLALATKRPESASAEQRLEAMRGVGFLK